MVLTLSVFDHDHSSSLSWPTLEQDIQRAKKTPPVGPDEAPTRPDQAPKVTSMLGFGLTVETRLMRTYSAAWIRGVQLEHLFYTKIKKMEIGKADALLLNCSQIP